MTCYAVVDTNVLVSALLSEKDDAATVHVLGKVLGGEIIPVYSNAITKICCFMKWFWKNETTGLIWLPEI